MGDLTCTPGATRKEAVRHGAHVWLYPGGYNMGPHKKGDGVYVFFGGDGGAFAVPGCRRFGRMARSRSGSARGAPAQGVAAALCGGGGDHPAGRRR